MWGSRTYFINKQWGSYSKNLSLLLLVSILFFLKLVYYGTTTLIPRFGFQASLQRRWAGKLNEVSVEFFLCQSCFGSQCAEPENLPGAKTCRRTVWRRQGISNFTQRLWALRVRNFFFLADLIFFSSAIFLGAVTPRALLFLVFRAPIFWWRRSLLCCAKFEVPCCARLCAVKSGNCFDWRKKGVCARASASNAVEAVRQSGCVAGLSTESSRRLDHGIWSSNSKLDVHQGILMKD